MDGVRSRGSGRVWLGAERGGLRGRPKGESRAGGQAGVHRHQKSALGKGGDPPQSVAGARYSV